MKFLSVLLAIMVFVSVSTWWLTFANTDNSTWIGWGMNAVIYTIVTFFVFSVWLEVKDEKRPRNYGDVEQL